jgi:hypothetical protein
MSLGTVIRQPTYNELLMEKYLREREAGKIAWRTESGKYISVKELDDKHLDNIINMLDRYREEIEHLGDLPEFL